MSELIQLENLQRENTQLLSFVGKVLKFHRENDCCYVDGGTIQDAAEESGLLIKKMFDAPCGEGCVCAEMCKPPYECLVLSELGLKATK